MTLTDDGKKLFRDLGLDDEGNEIGPGWRRVIYAHDCDECPQCGEPLCPSCITVYPAATGHNGSRHRVAVERIHYADCSCPGPHQEDEFEYREIDGVLMARSKSSYSQ